jgi:hypothetical protein
MGSGGQREESEGKEERFRGREKRRGRRERGMDMDQLYSTI